MQPLKPDELVSISPERRRIARVFKTHVERAIAELGREYDVSLQGRFDTTPIRIEIEVSSKDEIP